LPGLWATIVDARAFGRVSYNVPGTSTSAALAVSVSQSVLLSALTADWFAPKLGPVLAPTIDGLDLFQPTSAAISTTPKIEWQVPRIGKPTTYTISLFELTANGSATDIVRVASLTTTATSLVVPPGILVIGHFYALQLKASTAPNPAAPFRDRFPGASSVIASAMFVPTTSGGGSTNMPVDARTASEPDAPALPVDAPAMPVDAP
jgi:hypothetical protein